MHGQGLSQWENGPSSIAGCLKSPIWPAKQSSSPPPNTLRSFPDPTLHTSPQSYPSGLHILCFGIMPNSHNIPCTCSEPLPGMPSCLLSNRPSFSTHLCLVLLQNTQCNEASCPSALHVPVHRWANSHYWRASSASLHPYHLARSLAHTGAK